MKFTSTLFALAGAQLALGAVESGTRDRWVYKRNGPEPRPNLKPECVEAFRHIPTFNVLESAYTPIKLAFLPGTTEAEREKQEEAQDIWLIAGEMHRRLDLVFKQIRTPLPQTATYPELEALRQGCRQVADPLARLFAKGYGVSGPGGNPKAFADCGDVMDDLLRKCGLPVPTPSTAPPGSQRP